MSFASEEPGLARPQPQFFAVIRLARMVQMVKDRLKGLVCHRDLLKDPVDHRAGWKTSVRVSHHRVNIDASQRCDRAKIPTTSQSRSNKAGSDRSSCVDLLRHLDAWTAYKDTSLCQHAAKDASFLRQDYSHISASANLVYLRRISALTKTLLKRSKSLRQELLSEGGDEQPWLTLEFDNLIYERFFANLEHLLRCLQHIALTAIACLCWTWMAAAFLQSDPRSVSGDGWFTEWPNGRHPLSTTWPWNVRPSLLVLWGVCWMFYYGDGPSGSQVSSGADHFEFGQDFRTRRGARAAGGRRPAAAGLVQARSQPSSQATAALTSPVGQSNYTWPHHLSSQASANARRASEAQRPSNEPSAYLTAGVSQVPYIIPSSYVHSTVLPSTALPWTYNSTQTTSSCPDGRGPVVWQHTSPNDFSSLFPTSQPGLETATIQPDATPRTARYHHQLLTPKTQSESDVLSGTGFSWPIELPPAMQNYPSPHSDVSGPIHTSTYPAHAGLMLSPKHMVNSPSIAGSSESHPSSHKSLEPTRNAQGVLYCDFPDCRPDPPIFTRPCEWTKHIEKHTRPYVCNEPGCENIRGFTYSGGLQRHKREVHDQCGGPKARCLCPYKDCKRSTGNGFSRRENLQEHLRRVHRNVSTTTATASDAVTAAAVEAQQQPQEPQSAPPPSLPPLSESSSRKRRRRDDAHQEIENDGGASSDQPSSQDLKQEVKKLRREIREKDDRLRRLESQMEQLTRGQKI